MSIDTDDIEARFYKTELELPPLSDDLVMVDEPDIVDRPKINKEKFVSLAKGAQAAERAQHGYVYPLKDFELIDPTAIANKLNELIEVYNSHLVKCHGMPDIEEGEDE